MNGKLGVAFHSFQLENTFIPVWRMTGVIRRPDELSTTSDELRDSCLEECMCHVVGLQGCGHVIEIADVKFRS